MDEQEEKETLREYMEEAGLENIGIEHDEEKGVRGVATLFGKRGELGDEFSSKVDVIYHESERDAPDGPYHIVTCYLRETKDSRVLRSYDRDPPGDQESE